MTMRTLWAQLWRPGDHQLRRALAEQDRLRRELHHRVTNSLQIVASMVSLQARDADSADARQMHSIILSQIQTLTMVQNWLYQAEDGLGSDLRGLLPQLCASLEANLAAADQHRPVIGCAVSALALHPDNAIPVGFLITELAILAVRNAPPGPLHVHVAAGAEAEMTIMTVAAASFIGVDQVAAAGAKSTGRIIQAMVGQLHGSLAHDAVTGAYAIRFPAAPA